MEQLQRKNYEHAASPSPQPYSSKKNKNHSKLAHFKKKVYNRWVTFWGLMELLYGDSW